MEKTKVDSFTIVGIAVRTTNENNQAAKDIVALWDKFMTEEILHKIPNKTDNTIYAVYTDYESDHTKPYTTILGCKVDSLATIPEGMVNKIITSGNYSKFISSGSLMDGIVYATWLKIWDMDLDRKYTTDFEIYGEQAQDPTNAEVPIFIAIQ